LYELSEHHAGGNPFDSRNTVYFGSGDDATLNREIPRYAADSEAAEYLRQWYTPTGRIHDPVLAIHSLNDYITPEEGLKHYDDVTRREGTTDLFVQMWASGERRDEWFSFINSPERAVAAITLLEDWIKEGRRPEAGEFDPE
jgi:hypothetical protein